MPASASKGTMISIGKPIMLENDPLNLSVIKLGGILGGMSPSFIERVRNLQILFDLRVRQHPESRKSLSFYPLLPRDHR
jgi:hypothetical protein